MARQVTSRPNLTVQAVRSVGQSVTKRQATRPTGRAPALAKHRSRTVEWMPSAPMIKS